MNWVSLLGLIALLAIAWIFSTHRKRVRFRIVAWGLGLQFLFAVILLREDAWSFAGMAALGGLIVAYLLRAAGRWPVSAAGLAAAIGVGLFAHHLVPSVIPAAIAAAVVLLLLNARLRWAPGLQPWGGVMLIALGVAFLTSRGLHGQAIFATLSERVASFLNLSDYGAKFLFGNLASPEHYFPGTESYWPGFGFQFAFKVLPTIVFFGGFMSVLYYLGIMQKLIETLSRFMRWTMQTSGAETLSCSANIFVGQTEAPLLIRRGT
jgi:CNT family concentrative nucleoside transporter